MRDLKHRHSFLPAFLFAILVWLGWILFFVSFAPETTTLMIIFYLLFFLANFFTFSLIFGHSRRGLLAALAIVTLLILKQIKQFHPLNFILLSGLLLSIELYFRKR